MTELALITLVVCSNCAASVCPSYGLPGKLRAPTIKPLLWVTLKTAATPPP